ncbi:MAG: GGDEF domain-containing protein [Gammaproteobacteria bacterium]|nr:GGDEF domain-containing protein [Gammaproteobacteria bacterium]
MGNDKAAAGTHPDGNAPPTPAIAQVVDRRLLRNLLDNAGSTLVFGAVVSVLVGYAVWRTSGVDAILLWIGGVVGVSLLRLLLVPLLRRHLDDVNAQLIGGIYAALAAVGGVTWGLFAYFDDVGHPIGARLMVLIVLVGLPVASLSTNAIYRPVFFAFSLPFYAAMLYWAWWRVPEMAIEFSLLATIYSALIAVTAWRYNASLRSSLMRDIENEMLLHEVHSMNDELERMAYQDSLTGLSNRRSFEKTTQELLARRRDGDTLALMLIDLDNFKSINDTLGHAAGDAVLIELSQRIEDNSRLREMIAYTPLDTARIGGDEFIALYRLDPGASIEPVAGRILRALMAPMRVHDKAYQPAVSIGIALAPTHADNLDDLLHAADQAMYRAKSTGGGRYVVATGDRGDGSAPRTGRSRRRR